MRRRFDKARAYHRKACMRLVRWDGVVLWRFFYGPPGWCYEVREAAR